MAKTAPAGPFRDLSEFLTEAEPIPLPINGKTYRFPGSISGRAGLLLTTALDATMAARQAAPGADGKPLDPELVELLTDEQEASVWGEVFGGVDLELVRDGHDSRVIRHVFLTLITWHTAGEEAAVAAWESLGKAPANRATRRAASRSASSAAAPTTRKRTSGSGTRATSRASGSGSRTSSRGGR